MELKTTSLSDLSDNQVKFLTKKKLNEDQLQIALAVDAEARRQGVNPEFVWPMVYQESKFQQDAKSPKGAIGVMQLIPSTAKGLKVDPTDVSQNISGGISLLKELMQNPKIGNDPYKILAGYNASTKTRNKFYESGDLADLPDETITHMLKVNEYYGGDLPKVSLTKTEEAAAEPAAGAASEAAKGKPTDDEKVGAGGVEQPRLPRALTGGVGAAAGVLAGSGAAVPAAAMRAKYDLLQLIDAYPDARAAFKAGKSPSEVLAIALKNVAGGSPDLPPAQGPLTGQPAGGRMTQNWIASQDAEGRYTDVGMKARDQAEAHRMKLAAMAAEDKINQIAPEFRADPNRSNLFIPQSAGSGPRGVSSAPIPSVAPVVETPTVLGQVKNIARNYTPFLKMPVMGGLTGFGLAQGAADVYNRVKEKQPVEATASGLGTLASTAAPFVSGALSGGLGVAGAAIPLYLGASDRIRYLQKHPEEIRLQEDEYDAMGNRLR
jgi:hypothetical protein